MSTTRTRTARYYGEGFSAALDCAAACRKMADAMTNLHRDETGPAADLIAARIADLTEQAAEWEREAEVWIEDAADAGYGPEDLYR